MPVLYDDFGAVELPENHPRWLAHLKSLEDSKAGGHNNSTLNPGLNGYPAKPDRIAPDGSPHDLKTTSINVNGKDVNMGELADELRKLVHKPLEPVPEFKFEFKPDTYPEDRVKPQDVMSLDHKHAFKYQVEGVEFATLKAHGRVIINDDTGLGKTVQGLLWVACNRKKAGRFVVITKAKLKYQWSREAMRWLGEDTLVQILDGSEDHLLPGCHCYILSYDSLARIPDAIEKFKALKVKTLILDEVQMIKNSNSNRGQSTREFSRLFKNVISLSATPIKNNAGEYWNILNIVRPDKFPDENDFIMKECQAVSNGYGWKIGGLYDPDGFRKKTEDFIIRRLREDVLPDLPKIRRNFRFIELGKEVDAAYRKLQKEYDDMYDEATESGSMSFKDQSNIMGMIAKMRHLTGLAKIKPVIEFVEDYLEETGKPYCIFLHHDDVMKMLAERLKMKGIEPALFTSGLDPKQAQAQIDAFRSGKFKVAIFSTLAYGEGVNLQFCDAATLMERQWNPANEEQVEGRFPRPGSVASSVEMDYPLAVGTVDEFLNELVEKKREIVGNTLDGQAIQWNQTSIMQELAATLREKGSKRWTWR